MKKNWVRISTCWVIAASMFTGTASAQQPSGDKVKVLTVCEVLSNVTLYAGTIAAVVGRLERSVSLIDHYEFLSQDRCTRPMVSHGHRWPDKIQVWTAREAGTPKPPAEIPMLVRSIVTAKLSIVRQTTELGEHQEPRLKDEGRPKVGSASAAVPNAWAVVYGRIVKAPNLNEDCGAAGCGGDDVPLVIIAEPYNVYRLRGDGAIMAHE